MTWSAYWTGLVVLGAYHGVNPGMGWLFAVARGLQQQSRRAVLVSLLPIAAGHEGSVAAILLAAALARPLLDQRGLRFAAAGALVGFAILLLLRRRLHPYLGMRLSLVGLAAWSFLMSSAHGAGLMAVPLYLGLQVPAPGQLQAPAGILQALAAATLHTTAMLTVMGIVAVLVYDRFGLGLLRRAWVNLDLVWVGALLVAGVATLFS